MSVVSRKIGFWFKVLIMNRFYSVVLAFVAIVAISSTSYAQRLPYQDESLSISQRVEDLLGRLTVDEKIDLLRATSPAN